MVSRVTQSLVEENRIKARQVGAGRPSILDEETLQLVVQTPESECNAERRRRESVMYCDRSRIKESDLLNIANYYLEQKGKPCLNMLGNYWLKLGQLFFLQFIFVSFYASYVKFST